MFNRNIFSTRLNIIKQEKGLLSKDIAAALGIRQASVSQFERGITAPSLNSLIAMAKLLDCSLDYLCGLSDVRERK